MKLNIWFVKKKDSIEWWNDAKAIYGWNWANPQNNKFLITFGIPNTLATFYEFFILHKCNLFQIICLVKLQKDYMRSWGQWNGLKLDKRYWIVCNV
jgi:hypothetical protein